jgi:hypothetical protein
MDGLTSLERKEVGRRVQESEGQVSEGQEPEVSVGQHNASSQKITFIS